MGVANISKFPSMFPRELSVYLFKFKFIENLVKIPT